MNTENIHAAIAIMQRAKNLDMFSFQNYTTSEGPVIVQTEEELHQCGNTACFAGYIALSPEWKATGGAIDPEDGSPVAPGDCESIPSIIAKWLGIEYRTAWNLTYGDLLRTGAGNSKDVIFCRYYDKLWSEVKPKDVIAKLKAILSDGEPE